MATRGWRSDDRLLLWIGIALLAITVAGGCLDRGPPGDPDTGENGSPQGSADEAPVANGTGPPSGSDDTEEPTSPVERRQERRLLAEGAGRASALSLGPPGDGTYRLPRSGNVIANGTAAIVFDAEFDPRLRNVRAGYQLDDEPIAWQEMDPDEPVRVEVEPDETEAAGATWSFHVDEDKPLPVRSSQTGRSWHMTVHANGTYPAHGDPVESRNWAEYRELTLEGFEVQPPTIPDVPAETGQDRPVVAIVDTGVNPFHEAFRNESLQPPGSLAVPATNGSSGAHPHYVNIDPPDHDEAWVKGAVESRTLYRFSATPHYFYSLEDNVTSLDDWGHGTAVASALLDEFPQAAIVNVQVPLSATAQGIDWASQQDWIDVITVSRACPNDCVDRFPEYRAGLASTDVPQATQTAWEEGKLVVFAAGNDPTVTGPDPHDGPPWVISVGGADTDRKGTTWGTSKAPDVVSAIRVDAAYHDATEGTREDAGTSFSAPIVSATLAEAIDQLREEVGHDDTSEGNALVSGESRFTNADLREALNASAEYWETTAYEPLAKDPDLIDLAGGMGAPINPAAPWLQMGWGYVDSSIVAEMVRGLLDGDLPEKPPAAQAYMGARQEARHEAWR